MLESGQTFPLRDCDGCRGEGPEAVVERFSILLLRTGGNPFDGDSSGSLGRRAFLVLCVLGPDDTSGGRVVSVDWNEVRAGVSETARYVLSHHERDEWDRCYAPAIGGRRVRVCARCTGIYPGILGGVGAFVFAPPSFWAVWIPFVFPFPALVDWTISAATARRGRNAVRTLTGFLLGYGYAIGGLQLLVVGELLVVLAGVGYGVLALGALVRLEST